MTYPIPVFFIATVVFVIVLTIKRTQNTRHQEDVNEAFLDRERQANATRKKDISNLNYLPFSTDSLPISEHPDEELLRQEAILRDLSGKRILNLSMYSNTDLKLMYGPANLNDLTEYDDNYHLLSVTLFAYAKREEDLGRTAAAVSVLEYAMSLKIDSSKLYLLLAELYQKQLTPEKIQAIADAAASMDESFAALLLPKLDAFRTLQSSD